MDDASRIQSILEEFFRQHQAGEEPDIARFCANYEPRLRDEIRRRCEIYVKEYELLNATEDADLPSTDPVRRSSLPDSVPDRIDEYRILDVLGEGGMGATVYLVWDEELHRKVALKVLPVGLGINQRLIDRFIREGEAGGKLSHPNVVRVLAAGNVEGGRYIVMDYVEGPTLAQELSRLRDQRQRKASDASDGRLPSSEERGYAREIARIVMELARGLDYAHKLQIIHRDVKPANILLQANGHPVLVDFGLAKDVSKETMTGVSGLVGTLPYMSPEQVVALHIGVDHRTDVYSLGVVMYEMLTLSRPFRGNTNAELTKQISFEVPPPIRRLNPRVHEDLQRVCSRAMEKRPDDRFADASEMADWLQMFVDGEPLPPKNFREGLTKWWKRTWRSPAKRVAMVAVLLFLITIPVLVLWIGAIERRALVDQLLTKLEATVSRPNEDVVDALLEDLQRELRDLGMDAGQSARMKRALLPLVTIEQSEPGLQVSIARIDLVTGELGAERFLGETPIRRLPVDRGYYRIIVSKPGVGFCEMTRLLVERSREYRLSPIIKTTSSAREGMVPVAAGRFRFGSRDAGAFAILKARDVELPGFWIDKHEVSVGDYKKFMAETGHRPPRVSRMSQADVKKLLASKEWDDKPILWVSYEDARDYAEWAGKRLPTVHEWQRAARGRDGNMLPWSPTRQPIRGKAVVALFDVARDYERNPVAQTPAGFWRMVMSKLRPVSSPAEDRTADGVCHMLGNALEWTESIPNNTQPGGDVQAELLSRMVMGSSWDSPVSDVSLEDYGKHLRTDARHGTGFRCVKSARR